MAGSSQRFINLLPQTAHSATICGQTGCGKTVFILDPLEGPYWGFFQHILVLCPTVRHNKTYQQCPWIWTDPEVYLLDHSPVGIFAVQGDREGEPRGPGDNHIVFTKVGEPDKQLLVLVDNARVVGDDHRLSHSFDTQRLAEGVVRIKLAPKFA